jgi:glycerophosphoryl diester phosphodiesterase
MKIIGHRGARGESKENTAGAISVALDAGVDMIEIDLRIQGDSVVLTHDPINPDLQYPDLSDILELIAGKVPLNLEIKELAVVDRLPDLLRDYSGAVLLSSFDYKTLKRCRTTMPDTPIAVLESWSGVRATTRAKKLDTKRIHMNQRWLWSGFVSSMTRRGWQLYAYTVNSKAQANRFEKAGLQGIFTDYPSRFLR